MSSTEQGTEVLSEATCWERLRKTSIGRLGVQHDGQPSIYPINYLVDNTSIVFRTRPNSKISRPPMLDRVAFEIDGFDPAQSAAWSVLIKGFGRFLDSDAELAFLDELPLLPWVVADRSAWIRIVPVEVTGRRFHLIDGVVTDASVGWTSLVGNAHRSSAV